MKSRTKPFGWLVVGTGRIAGTVMREITRTGRHTVTAAYSRTYSKAQNFTSRFGGTAYTSLADALADKSVDGVYIATPHSAHFRVMLECISAGIPVLCEKSFTVNSKQAERALNCAHEKGVYVLEGMWTRFNPVVKKIREWVSQGAIGEIKEIQANFCLPICLAKPFMSDRVYKPEYAGGALLDLGVYPIAYSQMLLGEPENIQIEMRLEGGVDYHDEILLNYANGAKCVLKCSFDELKTYNSVIIGTKGDIRSNMFYKPTHARLNGEFKDSVRCKRGYIYQFDAVAEDVLNGRKGNDLMSQHDTLAVMKIMDECRRLGGLVYPAQIEDAAF